MNHLHAMRRIKLRDIVKLQNHPSRKSAWRNARMAVKALRKKALDFLAEVGYDPVYGARPLKRAIQRELETQIAKAILRGEFTEGDTIFVDVEHERLSFKRLPSELVTAEMA